VDKIKRGIFLISMNKLYNACMVGYEKIKGNMNTKTLYGTVDGLDLRSANHSRFSTSTVPITLLGDKINVKNYFNQT